MVPGPNEILPSSRPRAHWVLAATLLLLCVRTAKADGIWPAALVVGGMLTWWAIAIGLVVEFACLRWRLGFSTRKSIVVDLAMNSVSTIAGIPLAFGATQFWEFFTNAALRGILPHASLYEFHAAFLVLDLIVGMCFAIFATSLIECGVIRYGFRTQIGRRGFWWLTAANGVSVTLALVTAIWLGFRH